MRSVSSRSTGSVSGSSGSVSMRLANSPTNEGSAVSATSFAALTESPRYRAKNVANCSLLPLRGFCFYPLGTEQAIALIDLANHFRKIFRNLPPDESCRGNSCERPAHARRFCRVRGLWPGCSRPAAYPARTLVALVPKTQPSRSRLAAC